MNKEAEKSETIHGKAVRHEEIRGVFKATKKKETERTSDSCSDFEKSYEKQIFS